MLCCQDTWSHLRLTTLKPWINQYISFSYGNAVLSYVNVLQTLSSSWFHLIYSGIVPLIHVNKTICWYSPLLQDSSQSFYGQGWIIWCHSKFYDIPFFSLTDCEWLYNIQLKTRRGVLFCPLLMPMSEAFSISLYFNKTLLHKSSERFSLVSGPRLNSSPLEAKNTTSYCSATTFQYQCHYFFTETEKNIF